MPTYLSAQNFPFSKCSTTLGEDFRSSYTTPSQIPCPTIYEHIKSCTVCQQAVKNTCAASRYGETYAPLATTIDKNTIILYGIFFLFIIILITIMFKK